MLPFSFRKNHKNILGKSWKQFEYWWANKVSRKRILNKSKHEKHHQNENIKCKALPKMEI